jgi:sugar phosphate isomerase/epimerase
MYHEVDAPNVGVNPDLGNIIRAPDRSQDWRSALIELAPVTNFWHVKNYRAGKAVPIWEGEIDYRDAMSIMSDHDYQGWVSIESYLGQGVLQLQKQSLEYLKRLEAS